MFVGLTHPRHISALAIFITALLCAVLWRTTVRAADPPIVQGLMAVRVSFGGEAREKLTSAGFDLLAKCTVSRAATEEEWELVLRQCHLHFTFATSRSVTFVPLVKPEKVEVAEMIITFPLWLGRVWVRSGDEYTWFAKWPGQERERLCKPIQELLKEATLD